MWWWRGTLLLLPLLLLLLLLLLLMGEGVFFQLIGGQSFVFDSRSIRVRSTAPGMGCFSALECTVADVARTCSGTKHHETLDLATAATEERKPSHGSTFGVPQEIPAVRTLETSRSPRSIRPLATGAIRGAACTERALANGVMDGGGGGSTRCARTNYWWQPILGIGGTG